MDGEDVRGGGVCTSVLNAAEGTPPCAATAAGSIARATTSAAAEDSSSQVAPVIVREPASPLSFVSRRSSVRSPVETTMPFTWKGRVSLDSIVAPRSESTRARTASPFGQPGGASHERENGRASSACAGAANAAIAASTPEKRTVDVGPLPWPISPARVTTDRASRPLPAAAADSSEVRPGAAEAAYSTWGAAAECSGDCAPGAAAIRAAGSPARRRAVVAPRTGRS